MLFTLFAALAAPLGTTDIPDQPESHRPTAKFKERVTALRRGEGPRVLVPFNYLRHGRRYANRYYDENGEVYRLREARIILGAEEASAEEMRLHHKYQRRASTWAGVSAAAVPLTPLNWAFMVPAMIYSGKAVESFEEALVDYNGR